MKNKYTKAIFYLRWLLKPVHINTNGLSLFIIFLFLSPILFFIQNEKNDSYFLKVFSFIFVILIIIFFILIFYRLQNQYIDNEKNNINFSINQLNITQKEK